MNGIGQSTLVLCAICVALSGCGGGGGGKRTTYTITASAGSGGTIAPSGAVTVPGGGSETFTATPQSGYQVNTWILDQGSGHEQTLTDYTGSTTCPLNNIQRDHTLQVTFKPSDGPGPTAAFTVTPASSDTTTTFTFDASGCTDPQDDVALLQVRWDWTNDGTWDTGYSTTKTATHRYATDGTYTVKLAVKDTDGHTNTTTRTVTVAVAGNTPPTASFTITPATGDTTTSFSFNAAGCSDAQDAASALQVRWDWNNDGTWDTGYATTKTATHRFSAAGTYMVRLEVKDTGGLTASVTHTVTVTAPPRPAPVAAFTLAPASGNTGTEFVVDASGSTDAEDATSALQAQWDWDNDGTWDTGYAATKTAYHTFSAAGTYTVKLRVKNTASLTDTATRVVTATAAPVPSAISAFSSPTYIPGAPLQVHVAVIPAASTMAYAVEDTPPTGWTVSNINNSGAYDAVNNKVKWGPFFDNTARTFTYTVTPPAGASGTKTFAGTVSLDGTNINIIGARNLTR